jgi:large subunit ribosomal protein L2
MALKKYSPTTPGIRFRVKVQSAGLYKGDAEASLTTSKTGSGGRNNYGNITSRWIGGGHKQQYRIIDFKRNKFNIAAIVDRIEYDPNRTAYIALLIYQDGEKRYIIAPEGLKPKDTVMSGDQAEIKVGNCLALRRIPLGSMIHNLEIKAGKGAQLIRSAGTYGVIMAKEGDYAHIQMPSSEIRMINLDCLATLGQVSNLEHENESIGKAGRSRWMGRMPRVRGVAMNPVDHPMGGGEGKSSGGRHPTTPWGKKTKGLKTRKPKPSDKFIIKKKTKKNRG